MKRWLLGEWSAGQWLFVLSWATVALLSLVVFVHLLPE